MGYLFIGIALTAGIIKAYCGKKTSNYTRDIKDAMIANSLRMIFCIVIGLVLILLQGQIGYIKPNMGTLAIAALSGISTAVFVVTWLLAVKRGAYMMVEVFLMLGVLLPMLAGNVFFHEAIHLKQWIGIAALTIATFIMCSYNNTQKQKLTAVSLLLLVVCGLASGLADFSQKLFVRTLPKVPVSIFNFYTYVFSAFVLLVALFFVNKKNDKNSSVKDSPVFTKILGYILVMSVCLYANSYFKTKAAVYIDSAQLYPLNQGSALILSTVMSAVVFREKITVRCALGLLIAFIGLIFITIL